MKKISRQELEAYRPTNIMAHEAIEFCLEKLYADKMHEITDEIVHHLTYEEVIGAFLLARDRMEALVEGDEREDYGE